MSENTENDVLAPYAATAAEVVKQIGARAGTDGDPQLYGFVYARLVSAYMESVMQVRPVGAVDGYVLDIFRALALSVSGGVQPQRFRDVITAALSASVHVEAAIAAVRAQNAAKGPQDAPEAPAKPEPAWEPAEGEPVWEVPDLTDEDKAILDRLPIIPPDHPFNAPVPPVAERGAGVLPDPDPDVALAAADEEDEARASDEDLLRWTLTPGSDPWGDLLEEPEPGESSKREMRLGVTQAMVQARFERLHGLLDTSKAPDGVKPDVWEEAKRRAMPITFGDRGAA